MTLLKDALPTASKIKAAARNKQQIKKQRL